MEFTGGEMEDVWESGERVETVEHGRELSGG